MASYRNGYSTAVDTRPGAFERLLRHLGAQLMAWLGPKVERAARLLFKEFVRGAIAVAALVFAVIAAAYGLAYFFSFLVDLLDMRLPHWAALLITAAGMLIPAGIAALLALWQLYKMRTVRATVAGAAYAGTTARTYLRGTRSGAAGF
ncbi:phage holin family protein [Nocardia inohanensis]|uniref:phage holin family protein n=1 Tax=Nocardia inohanensis TaxID=209246 RepID=UPI000832F004|nr:phage holin family protein [Nocardia inohanensis]